MVASMATSSGEMRAVLTVSMSDTKTVVMMAVMMAA